MLTEAAALLKAHYGPLDDFGEPGRWTTLVRLVLASRRATGEGDSWLDEGPLRSARETSQAGASGVGRALEGLGMSPRPAKPLGELAGWWIRDPAREAESAGAWDRPIEALREELRSLSGVNVTLADRILLFVGGKQVFPVDRGVIRIVGRHGWVDPGAEYDEWQSFFTRGVNEANVNPAHLSLWFSALGRSRCGPRPKCETCPLRGLLPPAGPVPLSADGE